MTSAADVLALTRLLTGPAASVEAGLPGFRLVRHVPRAEHGFGVLEYEAVGQTGPEPFAALGAMTEVGPDDDDTVDRRLRVIYDDPSRPARAAVYIDLDGDGVVRHVVIRVENR